MKKILYINLFVVLGMLQAVAQSSTENYVQTKVYQQAVTSEDDATTPESVQTSVSYFDGLGRPKQQIAVGDNLLAERISFST